MLYLSSNILKSNEYSLNCAIVFLKPTAFPDKSQINSTLLPLESKGGSIVLNSNNTFLNLFTFIAPLIGNDVYCYLNKNYNNKVHLLHLHLFSYIFLHNYINREEIPILYIHHP